MSAVDVRTPAGKASTPLGVGEAFRPLRHLESGNLVAEDGEQSARRRIAGDDHRTTATAAAQRRHDVGLATIADVLQARTALAQTLILDPKILLMDEPFGALDAMTKQRLQDELLELWERDRRTILFVTHDLEEAIYLGSRVVVMGREPNTVRSVMTVDLPRPRVDVGALRRRDE